MKRCPRCKLINPPSAARCDCGFDFESSVMKASYLDTAGLDNLVAQGAIDSAAAQRLQAVLDAGIRYVVFQYCISVLVVTFKRASRVYEIGPGANTFRLGLRYSAVSLLLGWWGIPWGPIWTIGTVFTNCQGGKDITHDLLAASVRRAT
jgi:hypothetical protein